MKSHQNQLLSIELESLYEFGFKALELTLRLFVGWDDHVNHTLLDGHEIARVGFALVGKLGCWMLASCHWIISC